MKPLNLFSVSSRSPRKYITSSNQLDDNNYVFIVKDLLDDESLSRYLSDASTVNRVRGDGVFGHKKPRYEICYTIDGNPYRYSNINNETIRYPQHVLELQSILMNRFIDESSKLGLQLNKDMFELSTGVDILYTKDLKGSGSIAAHSDDEMHWPLILVYSLGQTRYFRIRNIATKEFTNVEIPHNSLLAMYGEDFQTKYTHQIDKLKDKDELHDRHSLNIRYTWSV